MSLNPNTIKKKPPSIYCLTIIVFVIFVLLLHKKLYIVLFKYSIMSCLGFGKEINKWLQIGIINVFIAPPFLMGWGGGHIVSPLSVHTSVHPVCNTNGFRAISYERIGILD